MEHGRALMIGGSDGLPVVQLAGMSNRHGLIAGATGTGKTVTLQVLAVRFFAAGSAGLRRRCQRRPVGTGGGRHAACTKST